MNLRRLFTRFLPSALLLLCMAVALGTWRARSHQLVVAAGPRIDIDTQAIAARLAGAVRLRTLSEEAPSPQSLAQSRAELLRLHDYLAQSFPQLHRELQREVIGDYSLLYTWKGQDPVARPILLMAHQDVVPIAPGTETQWHADPFGGEIRDGFVWGRGAWDDKGNLMAQLEAVEALLGKGFKPQRTIYLAFGHDEENGGADGATAIAKLLAQRGVHCEFALDEGLLITEGIMPGLDAPLALIGVAEKGSLSLKLRVTATPGHSSMPPRESAIGILARALERVEAAPMPVAIGGVATEMFDTVAPEMHGVNRVVMSNRWLFGPVIRHLLEQQPSTNAMLRTTTALTIVNAGNKENVLPGLAEAVVNFRLVPGDTAAAVTEHVRRAIDDPRVTIELASPMDEASAVASRSSVAYQSISRATRSLVPDAVVAPGLMIGATDSRHMTAVADNIYRYSPVRARPADLARFHGTDERMAIDNYADLIRFYELLISDSAGVRGNGGASSPQ
jgi:carboxypeptidase PM20D1